MNTAELTTPARIPHAKISYLDRLWMDGSTWFEDNAMQVIIAVAIATAIVAILLGIRSLGSRMCLKDPKGTGWPAILGRVVDRTRLWFMVALAAELVVSYSAAPVAIASTIRTFFVIAGALQAALWLRQLVLGAIEHRAGADPDNRTLGSAMGLIRGLVSFALFAIAMVLILDNLGVNVTGLVAGLGIGGIAIGLAAQGIFSDLFAALAIIFDKPFRIGETVSWDQTTGTVERIGMKTTRIRSVTGEQVVVSNAKLLEKELHNMTMLHHRRYTLKFGVTYQTAPDVCAAIPDMLGKIVHAEDHCEVVNCGMTSFGASSLDFDLVVDISARLPGDAFKLRHAICINILKAFNEAGIDFAYPAQVTFTAAPDGTMIMPYPPHQTDRPTAEPA